MTENEKIFDWASASKNFDILKQKVNKLELSTANEAQTRFDVIDELIKGVLGWKTGQVKVENYSSGKKISYIDYVLSVGDATIVIEAKKSGAAFPNPTLTKRLKLSGSILGVGDIAKAIAQAEEYALTKKADLVCVTNGSCWCFFSTKNRGQNSYATLLSPFNVESHPEELFGFLAEPNVRKGSLEKLIDLKPSSALKAEDRLVSTLKDADGRLNRNNIADHITPALNQALYADALLSNLQSLEKCYVSTEGRSKFDNQLGMHLADPKPSLITSAPRIKRDKDHGPLESLVDQDVINYAPPVTVVIGPVGAGKSTYLKHFELISGKKTLEKHSAHWIYIDFEEMGIEGNPRVFLYEKIKEYLLNYDVDYDDLVKPAYEDVAEGLKRGPLAPIMEDESAVNKRIADHIQKDFDNVEPYVDRVFGYLAKKELCVIVMDNVDLYEVEELETAVFAEGLALSKRLKSHVIVSLRDRTFVKHRNSPTFNAYELRKLWLDPPPFRSVLSKRLTYSQKILQGKKADIATGSSMHLKVPDLGAFFEIVQQSVLRGEAGEYIENMSDLSTRKGLNLITHFLTSGHIQADRALKSYIDGNTRYYFPFHEIFKGTALHQWKYFKENRADCINLFDARLGSKRIRLLRLAVLSHLLFKAKSENTIEVPVKECLDLLANCGAAHEDTLSALSFLEEHGLIRTVSAEPLTAKVQVVISHSGGYYLKRLAHTFVYAEQCMLDTAIEDTSAWSKLSELTDFIETERELPKRMEARKNRIVEFMNYLSDLEDQMLGSSEKTKHLKSVNKIRNDVVADAEEALRKAEYWHKKSGSE